MKITLFLIAFGALISLYIRWKRSPSDETDAPTYATADEIRALPPDALYPAPKGNKWGYINAQKEWVIPPIYDEAADFVADRAVVGLMPPPSESDGTPRLGLIDQTGKQIVPCLYQRLEYSPAGLARAQKNEIWGFIDGQGRVVIPFRYEGAGAFSEGLACVTVDGQNGFIDQEGRMVIAPRFNRQAAYLRFSEGYARASAENKDDRGGYIDKTGQYVISPQYLYNDDFLEGLATVTSKDNSLYGFIDKQGTWAIPARYQQAYGFSEGLASVVPLMPDSRTRQWSVIDKSGKAVLTQLSYRMVGAFVEGLAPVQSETSRNWGFINRQGREVIPTKYAGLNHFHNGLARMETGSLNRGLKIVYLTKTGHVFWQQE